MAVIRISGPKSDEFLYTLTGKRPRPRHASLCNLRDPMDGERLDRAVVLRFPAPTSFTGEDVVELQLHGSLAVCRKLIEVLGGLPGMRQAEPGEFTRRALLNGRLDLAQVEGLGDLLIAETEMQRQQALSVMEGALSRKAATWRSDLVLALAHVEATIDFADDDVPEAPDPIIREKLASVAISIDTEINRSRGAERLRDGFEVAIIGPPNVGKSTLINALVERDVALTSSVPGTTRDVIEVRMDIHGLPVTLLDTAGLRDAAGQIEGLGVARARHRANSADLRLFLVYRADDVPALHVEYRTGDIVALAKADLRGAEAALSVSGKTGEGLGLLVRTIVEALGQRISRGASVTRERQRRNILNARDSVHTAATRLDSGGADSVLIAEDIRSAIWSFDTLVGKTDVEAVLDVVFASFCLGK